MGRTVIQLENVSKLYRLGYVGTETLSEDIKAVWAKIRNRPNPNIPVGETDLKNDNYVWALKDINLDIKEGEIIGIIGSNGAGKSTLLKLLSRITTPTTGKIRLKGRIGSLLEVGTGFHPELTGRENTYLNGAILGMRKKEIKMKFDEIISFSGVENYIDTPVKRYSSGMTVKLAFSVAAHLDPEILIVDEVLAIGDDEFQKKALAKIKEVSTSEGRTILFVSHNMNSIQKLCKRVIYIDKGGIKGDGNPKDIVRQYIKGENINI